MIKQLFCKIKTEPKTLFLLDGSGAILSAFLLGVVLVRFERNIGIPSSTLYVLAIPPIFFAVYDFFCYRLDKIKSNIFLKGIATMNLLYCCLSIGLAFYHLETITKLGWSYILIEIFIVIMLAMLQLRMANEPIQRSTTKRQQ